MANQISAPPRPVEVPVGGDIMTFGSWEEAVAYFSRPDNETDEVVYAAEPVARVVYVPSSDIEEEGWRIVADRTDLPVEIAEAVGMALWRQVKEWSSPDRFDLWATRTYPSTGPNRSRRDRVEQEAVILNRTITAMLRRRKEKEQAFKSGRAAAWMEEPYAEPLPSWDNELRDLWYAGYREGSSKLQAARNEQIEARNKERADQLLSPSAAAYRAGKDAVIAGQIDEDRIRAGGWDARRYAEGVAAMRRQQTREAAGTPAYKPTAKVGDRIRLP